MQVTVYVTAEKHEFKIDKKDRQEGLQEALQQAKDGKEVSIPSDCDYLALLDDEEHMKLRQVQRG